MKEEQELEVMGMDAQFLIPEDQDDQEQKVCVVQVKLLLQEVNDKGLHANALS
jgi:hypothetical protein